LRRGLAGNVGATYVSGQAHREQHRLLQDRRTDGGFFDWFQHMTLPAVALAIGLTGIYARYIRTAMIVSLGEQYTTVTALVVVAAGVVSIFLAVSDSSSGSSTRGSASRTNRTIRPACPSP